MDKCLLTIVKSKSNLVDLQATTLENHGKRVKFNWRKIVTFAVYLVLIPFMVFVGVKLLNDRKYNLVSIAIAFLACIPFFLGFEKGKTGARELVAVSVMTAISVLGRIIFAPIPGFKPVTAIVIITAIAFGSQAGFVTGAMSAIVSNIFYGQGPWTPFQMFAWGILGFLAGIICKRGQRPNSVILIVIGIIGGALFSVMMDVWSVINIEGGWNMQRYLALVLSSFSFMAIYCVSNVIFLLLFTRSFLEKLNRVKDKFGLFSKM